MTESRNEFERRAEASEQAQGQGRTLLGRPTARGVRILLLCAILAVAASYTVDALGGNWLVQGLASGAFIGLGVAGLTSVGRGR